LNSVTEILNSLRDDQTVRVALPMVDSDQKIRLCGVYQTNDPPQFSLLFPENNGQLASVDPRKKCALLIDRAGQAVSLIADIEAIEQNRIIRFVADKSINHKQLRNYFRVDVNTPLVASSILPEEIADDGDGTWRLTGETVDVSGCGLLASFRQPIQKNQQIRLELVLPTTELYVVNTIAHVVRIKKISDEQYHIAFHFDSISQEDRDRIVGCCFEIQRKHLRLKVRVNGVNEKT